jgi:hypothetical protein
MKSNRPVASTFSGMIHRCFHFLRPRRRRLNQPEEAFDCLRENMCIADSLDGFLSVTGHERCEMFLPMKAAAVTRADTRPGFPPLQITAFIRYRSRLSDRFPDDPFRLKLH